MASKLSILVAGAAGRMGSALVSSITSAPDLVLSGAIEHTAHPQLGEDIGYLLGQREALGLPLSADIEARLSSTDVIIDFSHPDSALNVAEICAKSQTALVIGTTGFSEAQIAKLETCAQHAPILRAGNMSLGINLMEHLTRQCAERLGADFDIEVIESHHRLKRDAPSGTALMLGEAAAKGRGQPLEALADYARHGSDAPRKAGTIGFHAIRGGDIVGEHDVIFAADGERVILRHIATERGIFVRGALRAARWLRGRAPGQYTMQDMFSDKGA